MMKLLGPPGLREPEDKMITWDGLKGTADNGDRWVIRTRPQGGFKLMRNGLFLATAFNVTEAKIIADDIEADA